MPRVPLRGRKEFIEESIAIIITRIVEQRLRPVPWQATVNYTEASNDLQMSGFSWNKASAPSGHSIVFDITACFAQFVGHIAHDSLQSFALLSGNAGDTLA